MLKTPFWDFMNSPKKNISLLLVLLVAFIDYMGIGLVYPMFSSMVFHAEFALLPEGTSNSVRGFYLGILLAAMPILQFFSAPILGALSDQRGRKSVLTMSLLLGVLGYALSFFSVVNQNIYLLIFSRVLVGISAGSAAVVAAAIADLSTSTTKARNYGFYGMACGVGFTVGPFLGGMLSEVSILGLRGFSLPFLLSGIITFVNLLLVFFFFYETHFKWIKQKLNFSMALTNVKKAFHMPEIRGLILCVFVFSFGWSFFYEFAPVTWITDYHISASTLGMLYAFAAFFYAISSGFLIKPVVNRFSEYKVLFYGLLATGVYILILLAKPSLFWLWIYLPFLNFLVSLLFPTSTAMVSNLAGESRQGEVLGILQSMQSAAFALSPLTSGALVGLSINMPIIVGGLCMFIAAGVLVKFLKEKIFV